MIGALYSKSRDAKDAWLRSFLAQARAEGGGTAIYVYPKNRASEVPTIDRVYAVSYEDITKTRQWLHINAITGENSVLLLENPSRYPKITSTKFGNIKRLSMGVAHKGIVDIVPFTLEIKYLYTPLAYLDRGLLGYGHYYAWRENYRERGTDGKVHAAHDYDMIAPKLRGTCRVDYANFLCSDRQDLVVDATDKEMAGYADKRAALFAKEKSPVRIVTRLADYTHAMPSRTQAIVDLVSGLRGRTVIYHNLASYAKRLKTAIREAGITNPVTVTSYKLGADGEFDNCIYAESPIEKSYFLLDAESKLPPHCRVFHVRSAVKVDEYLYGQINTELSQIDGLTKEMWREQASE